MKNKGLAIAVLFILIQNTLYGFGDPITKNVYSHLTLYSVLTFRYWTAFICLMIIFGRRVIKELKNCKWTALILPGFCIASAFLVSNVALSLTSPTAVAFLRSTSTMITPVLALVVFKKPYGKKHIPILFFLMVGLYMLCSPDGLGGFGMGEILSLVSALLMAGTLVFAEDSVKKIDAITVTTVQTAFSAILTTVCAFTFGGGVHMETASITDWGVVVYLAICCTLTGYLLQNFALKSISASTVSVIQCAYPVMTAIFSYFIIGERIGLTGIIGALIIIVSVVAENILLAKEEK